MKTLEEMKAEMVTIQNKLVEFQTIENFTDEQITEINNLNSEFSTLKNQITAREVVENMNTEINAGTRQVAQAPVAPQAKMPNKVKNGGFAAAGEFFASIAHGAVDKRFKNEMFEKSGADGGYLIPSDFINDIQKKVDSDESLLGRTRQFKTGSNSLVLPTSEVAAWDGSGIQAYWEGEGEQYTKSKTKFGTASYRLHKLTALIPVTDELLEDAPALESWIRMEAPEAINHKVNSALIGGDGVGKPEGILNSGFKVKVAKVSGQTADTIVYPNIVDMEARLLPSATNALWLIHPSVKPQLRLMSFDEGSTTKVPVYLPANGAAGRPFETLMGREMKTMMGSMRSIGDEGDIILVDFKYMITALKTSGVKQSVSTHIYFDRDMVAFKFSLRVAGQCPYKAPVTPEYGDFEMSGFITLEDR